LFYRRPPTYKMAEKFKLAAKPLYAPDFLF
jgi:hypothetical protein